MDVEQDFLLRYGAELETEGDIGLFRWSDISLLMDFVQRFSSFQIIETDIGITRFANELETEGDIAVARWSDKSIEMDFLQRWASVVDVEQDFVFRWEDEGPEVPSRGDISDFAYLRRTGDGKPFVTLQSDTGDLTGLCPHTVVISARESQTQSVNIQVDDKSFAYSPYGLGSFRNVMKDNAQVSVGVDWGGVKVFEAIMAATSGGQDGPRNPAGITWPGVGHSKKLFQGKKDLETLGAVGSSTGKTNAQLLTEVCNLVGLQSNWDGIRSINVGGPYHRQQLTPAQVAKQMLDLTADSWREDGQKIVGYDPLQNSNVWDYTHDDQVIHRHNWSPAGNTVYDKVIGLRAISAGQLFETGEEAAYTEVNEFGEYTVSLPGLSGVTTKTDFRDYRGAFSDFRYQTARGQIVRQPRAPWPPGSSAPGPIIDASSVTFTWGAATEGVTRDGVTEAPGGISFYGVRSQKGTVGNRGPADFETRKFAGDENGESPLELTPTPLIDNGADLQALADKTYELVRYPIVNHTLVVPLNHKIKLGERIRWKTGVFYGGGIIGPFIIVGFQHVIRGKKTESRTTINIREYVVDP